MEMICLNDIVWTMLDLFDDIYLELQQILAAIERDDLAGLLELPPPQEFDPFKTIGRYC